MNMNQKSLLPSAPIQANVDLLLKREELGLTKYGVTLGDANLSHAQLLQHGLEEALDLANYLQAALQADQESRRFEALYRHVMTGLQKIKQQLHTGYITDDNYEEFFLDFLYEQENEAIRRGVRL